MAASGSGIGQMASGVFKSLVGISQLIAGGVQKKQAKKLEPQETDPNLVSMLDTFRTLRRAYSTGSEASKSRNVINRNMASGTNAITSLSGGNTGGTLAAIVSTQSRADNAASQLAAQLEKDRLGVLQMEDQQNDEIAQRKLDVRMMKYLQKMGQATSNIKGGTANVVS